MSAFANGIAVTSGVVVVLTGVAAIFGGLGARWRATAGSRRALGRSLNRLNAGMPAENLPSMLGPCVIRRDLGPMPAPYASVGISAMSPLEQQVFVTKHVCVDVYVEPQFKTVVAFCITVTDPRFAFNASKLSFGVLADVHIGRSKFADPGVPQDPERFACWTGARDAGYAEAHFAGNPGGYQSYVLAYLGTGIGDFSIDEIPTSADGTGLLGNFDEPSADDESLDGTDLEFDDDPTTQPDGDLVYAEPDEDDDYAARAAEWNWFRAKTTVNTFQVLGPEWSGGFVRPGVHGDITRLIREPPRTIGDRAREWRVELRARRAMPQDPDG